MGIFLCVWDKGEEFGVVGRVVWEGGECEKVFVLCCGMLVCWGFCWWGICRERKGYYGVGRWCWEEMKDLVGKWRRFGLVDLVWRIDLKVWNVF